MLYRKQTRSIWAGAEVTSKLLSFAEGELNVPLQVGQYFYLGFHERFLSRYFIMSVFNDADVTLSIAYSAGDGNFTAVDSFEDETQAFRQNGFLAWDVLNPTLWKKDAVTPVSEELYWIRIGVSANVLGGTAFQAIANLFCDARLLRTWYPEMVSDTRYLPTGRDDFYEQFNAGKQLVVQELIRMEAIKDESQILDVAELGIAATHASAYCILNGIPNLTETQVLRAAKAHEDMLFWLNKSRESFDLDNSGDISPGEENVGPKYTPRGGY